MKVNELAKELELPTSVVLEQCLRLGIDASWAGSDLGATDLVVLRAELANDDHREVAPVAPVAPVAADAPDDVAETPAEDPKPEPDPELEAVGARAGGSGGAAAVPPTAVGSMPEMTDELMDAAKHGAADPMDRRFAGAVNANRPPSVATDRSKIGASATAKRRYDAAIRPGVIALILAIAAVVAANAVDQPAVIAALWLGATVALVVALLSGNKARYRVTTHPEQRRGLIAAIVLMVASILGLVGLGTAVWTVVRSAPADQAPMGLGDLNSVNHARWGYQRTKVIADTGWERPAKDVGTCWAPENGSKQEPRRGERVEVGEDQVDCDSPHTYEVIGTHSVNHDADAAYPGVAALKKTALARCADEVAKIKRPPVGMRVVVEYPTSTGYADGDHDVTCVVVASRDVPLEK